MALSTQDRQTIRDLYAQAQAAGRADYQAASDFLNAPQVRTEQRTVQVPVTFDAIIDALSGPTLKTLHDSPDFRNMLTAAQDPARMATYLKLLAKTGEIPEAEVPGLLAALSGTRTDTVQSPAPSLWQAAFGLREFELADGSSFSGQVKPALLQQVVEGA